MVLTRTGAITQSVQITLAVSAAYESFDNYIRDKRTTTVDFRLLSKAESLIFSGSTDWVTGIYFKDQEESLLRRADI